MTAAGIMVGIREEHGELSENDLLEDQTQNSSARRVPR